MYSRILFPVDKSSNSRRVFEHVLSLAEKYNSEVVLLHTYQLIGEIVNVLGEQSVYIDDLSQNKTSDGEIVLKPYADELSLRGIIFEALIIKGDSDYEIVHIAESHQCSLIIVGSEDMTAWNRFFLSSTSENVAHHAKCPVLLVP